MAFASKKYVEEMLALRNQNRTQERQILNFKKIMDQAKEDFFQFEMDRAQDMEDIVEFLKTIKEKYSQIAIKGHNSGYDWNSDPENLTLIEGQINEMIDAAIKNVTENLEDYKQNPHPISVEEEND